MVEGPPGRDDRDPCRSGLRRRELGAATEHGRRDPRKPDRAGGPARRARPRGARHRRFRRRAHAGPDRDAHARRARRRTAHRSAVAFVRCDVDSYPIRRPIRDGRGAGGRCDRTTSGAPHVRDRKHDRRVSDLLRRRASAHLIGTGGARDGPGRGSRLRPGEDVRAAFRRDPAAGRRGRPCHGASGHLSRAVPRGRDRDGRRRAREGYESARLLDEGLRAEPELPGRRGPA